MNPMNPNLYSNQFPGAQNYQTGQFVQQPIGEQVVTTTQVIQQQPISQMNQSELLSTQALNNTNQRDIDRIIVHDTHGMPIKREHGAIFKGDVENHVRKTGLGAGRVDPYVPANQGGIIEPGYAGTTGLAGTTGYAGTTGLQNAPITETTNLEGTDPVMYDDAGVPVKQGFMTKMKGRLAGWKERRREKKILKQEQRAGGAGAGSSSSPSLSPERQGGYIAPVGTTGTGLISQDLAHTLPTYQTSASGIPIRDTTKDYVRNLATEVPYGTSMNPVYAAKDMKKTGTWDYPDQRIQRIEAHFPENVQTEKVLLTQQVPVMVEQPVIVQRVQPVIEEVVTTTTVTEQVPIQQQQFTQLTTTEIQNLTSQGLTELPTTQLAHLQINTELPVGVTFTPASQLQSTGNFIGANIPYQQEFNQSNFQQTNFQPNLQQGYLSSNLQQGYLPTNLQQDYLSSNLQQGNLQTNFQQGYLPSNLQQGNLQTNFQQTNLQQPNFQYEQVNAIQPGMLGDLTTTGGLRTIQETGLSNQGSFGFMPAGSSQPQVQETIVRTVEKDIINPNTQVPRY